MAVLGVVFLQNIEMGTSGKFTATIKVISNDGTSQGTTTTGDISMSSLTEYLLGTTIRDRAKAYMISDLGFTFGLLDTVTVLGASVL